jgi:hypothetical protein
LPREEGLAFRRREADRERGLASTSHTDTSQGGEYGSCVYVSERTNVALIS